eukprot:5101363-Amphidinium_carterae.2
MDNDVHMTDEIPTLTATTLQYIAPIDGDTADDLQRLHEDRRRREEAEEPEEAHHRLSQQTHTEYMDEMTRAMEARERLERRRTQPDRQRHPGTAKQLHIRYQALHQLVMTERTKRLRERELRREQNDLKNKFNLRHRINRKEYDSQNLRHHHKEYEYHSQHRVHHRAYKTGQRNAENRYDKKLIEKHSEYKQHNQVATAQHHLHHSINYKRREQGDMMDGDGLCTRHGSTKN